MSLVNLNFINFIKTKSSVIYLIVVGFFSILGQVVILRELNVAFYGTELIYILSFGFWLIGTAIGAAIGRRSFIPKEKNIHTLLLFSALIILIDIVFIRCIRKIFGAVEGGYLPFLIQVVALILALLPVSLISGLLFQYIAKKFVTENETLAKAYAIESAGGVLGGLSSTLLIGISNFSLALICCLIFISIALIYSWIANDSLQKYLSLVALIVVTVLLIASHQINLMITSWNHPNLVDTIDTPYGRITITSQENQICIFQDDALSYETESVFAEEFVQISTLQADNLNNVLVLGGGFEGIIAELLKLPVNKIDYVEINKYMIEVLQTCLKSQTSLTGQKHLPINLKNSLKNKKVKIIYNDPRKFLQSSHSYDLIMVGMPEPMSAQNNRFYTKEFFAQCSKALNNRGILAFKIRSSENLWTNQLTERNRSIYNALKSAFDNVLVLPGAVNIFIASKVKLITDTNVLINRFLQRKLETKLVTPQYINYIFTNDRFSEIQNMLASGTHNINSDLLPVSYGYTISIWLSKFFPEIAYNTNQELIELLLKKPLFNFIHHNMIIYLMIVVLVFSLILVVCKSEQLKRFILVLAMGFVGMILEIILILHYQSKSGVLYRDIGFLLTAFMVGLSLGAYLINKIFITLKNRLNNLRLIGILLLFGFFLLEVIIYFLIKNNLMNGLFFFFIALLLDGIFVAGIFSFTSLNKVIDQQRVIKQLYAADLIGGSLGSLIASLILIPAYGILISIVFISILTLFASILIL